MSLKFQVVLVFLILFFLFQFSNEHLRVYCTNAEAVYTRIQSLTVIFCADIHIQSEHVCLYCSLIKEWPWTERPWTEHLISLSKKEWASFRVFPFNHKTMPCHVYSDLMPSKQITRQTITYNRTNSDLKVKA